MAAEITITGDKELEKKLKKLPAQILKKVLRPAISAGTTPMKQALKRTIASSFINSEQFVQNVSKRTKINRKKGMMGFVGVKDIQGRTIKIKGEEKPFNVVLNILEFGSQKMNIKPRGFFKRAFEESKSQAQQLAVAKAKQKLKEVDNPK